MFLVEVVVARLCTKIIVFGMLCCVSLGRSDGQGGYRRKLEWWLDGISSEIYKEKELQFVGVTDKTG